MGKDADSIHGGRTALAVAAISLFLARSCPAQSWTDQREAGPFVIRADFPLDQIKGLVDELAQLQSDLVRILGMPPANQRIQMYLFQGESPYRRFLHEYYPDVPYRRAMYTKIGGVGRVFAYRSGQFEVDLRHESTHALLHSALPTVPIWIDEGLAEYFEEPPEKRVYDSPHMFFVRWSARVGSVPSLANLEKKTRLEEMGGSEYRSSWAWVHFMIHGPAPAHEELCAYLNDLRTVVAPPVLSQRLAQKIPQVERQFAAHFKAWSR
jgi:hypothetical protein